MRIKHPCCHISISLLLPFFPRPFGNTQLLQLFHSSLSLSLSPVTEAQFSLGFCIHYMAVKLYNNNNNYLSLSSSNCWLSNGTPYAGRKVSDLHCLQLSKWGSSRKGWLIRHALLSKGDNGLVGCKKYHLTFAKPRRRVHIFPFASADDDVTVNGSPQASTSTDLEKMRVKLNSSLEDVDFCDGLVQALYDAARVFELAIKEHKLSSSVAWFSTAWLGVDPNPWVKALSYQAAVYSLLHAASEISSRGDGRDINVIVQRSLLRLSAPLESIIREKLSAKQPEAYEWFWSEQVPAVGTSFVNKFEGNGRFTAAIALSGKNMGSSSASDLSLLLLALTCNAAITKLGPAKVSCSQFFSMMTEINGSLMDMLVGLIPISQAYNSIKDIGLHREFLVHFGPRAAVCGAKVECGSEEVVFWVNLAQRQLQQAVDKEKIWSRLTTSESIEVLEKDLAVFGFFIALGRSTQSFLLENGFDTLDEPIEDFIRYLIGGSVLYYPQLSSISLYQLYVEVVCEELDWLPFYPGITSITKQLRMHRSKQEGPPNAEAVPQAFDVCSHWIQSFIKYSTWLESPSNVKAAEFLSIGHKKLMECMEELGMIKDKTLEGDDTKKTVNRHRSTIQSATKESVSFDEALRSVEEAVLRLEKLLQELHVSSSGSEKENLKAACSDLEKIRKLRKEAEFLEASFRAKADSLQQGVNGGQSHTPAGEEQQYIKGKSRKNVNVRLDRSKRNVGRSRGFWSIFVRPVTRKPDLESDVDAYENYVEQSTPNVRVVDQESSEINRFEHLRNELIELEKRVQRSANQSENNEELVVIDDGARYSDDAGAVQMARGHKKENIIEKSLHKLKETGTDVWQGTQLLAIDATAAMGLLRRALIGDELTEKEKKTLKRTLTDMASVVPIGVLMLLPVTAVGHAAMLAAINRYVPALIPSTYAPERLDLLRQLEKVKKMTAGDMDSDEEVDDVK